MALRSPPRLLLAKAAALLSLAAFLLGVAVPRLGIEWEWFAQFGFESVALRRWLLQLVAFLLVMGLGVPLQLQQLKRCWILRQRAGSKPLPAVALLQLDSGSLLAILAVLLVMLVGGLAYLGVQARGLIAAPFSGDVISGFPVVADLPPLLLAGLGAALLLPLMVWPLTTLRLLLSAALAGSATALARGWSLWVPALLAVPFDASDPLTGFDLSFTVLQLPALRLLLSVLFAQATVGLAGCLWLTFTEGSTLSDLHFVGLSLDQKAVLKPQIAVLAAVAALSAALSPFDLMVHGSGVASGAGFVDLHVRLPLRLLLSVLLALTAFGLVVPMRRHWLRQLTLLPLVGTALLLPIAEFLVAPQVQRLWVEPRELVVETEYLKRSISATRKAFGLNNVKELTLKPKQQLTQADLDAAPGTLANIRLWDSRPLLAANRQLQQLRLYYTFPSAAVDRYVLGDPNQNTVSQQVLIAAREIDTSALPSGSRTWLNRHLVFTHGYGFTVSPVNVFGPDGLPSFLVKDLGPSAVVQGIAALGISDASARRAFPVGRPRLYYGSAPASYAIAPTQVEEFDYPSGELNVWNHFEGTLGIRLGNAWQRFKAATYLSEPRVLFSGSFTPRSLLLIRRQVKERLRALAPFLSFESEPYLVTVDLKTSPGHRPGQHQYWMLDGFTTSRSYPYSEANASGIRYLRNPVKAVVDAHDGRLWLYVSDPSDPILRTWQRAFPELFRPIAAMPKPLLQHIRVPLSQFAIQSERLLRYHVTDVRTFYNSEDEWAVPSEIYDSKSVPVQPYHATLQLPGEQKPEFVLLLPFSPVKRSNLVGWLAARNDPPNYGELLLVRFPQQRLLLGPEQISSLIAQDPQISLQFGLWGRAGGSQLVRGNLLVLPVGEGLLYVEPIYLRSSSNDLPTLVRVVVTDGRRFVMERDLATALKKLVSVAGSPAFQIPGFAAIP
ncbi:UPF0182 family protein [Synechococcus sp. CS-1325]|uniref:UPF0182 family protein n=1 Tax=unclassified Synechococcus TaxID=2626047 RepID=UPI000DB8BF5E|nr:MULTISPECIES: UPF0182 family protein [unclassified Synechococcus]MCT0199675.1 UPF0182 family protein [Synechococcus sp. CS-1325]MCT0213362.1 UPF0182 family protein [Synechococcus sp. CS-1326]MCT0232784.1 UPF0182 family protein [Synechococcus sp. CS-1327]PZV00314.1 MAG: membrane protein [Cyanobium sp.]